nr:hypothetical protein [Tanacetum cinerariifolium]
MDWIFTLGSTEEAENVKILQSCNGLLLYGDDFGSREFTIYEMTIWCSVWMVTYRVYTDDFMTPLPEVYDNHDDNDADDDELLQQFQAEHNVYEFISSFSSMVCLGFGSEEQVLAVSIKWSVFGKFSKWSEESVATFEGLDELIKITGSTELHKRMRFWFVQEIAEEEGLLKFLCNRCDDLRRKNARRRVLIREMEALGERGVVVDSLESLKQTH